MPSPLFPASPAFSIASRAEKDKEKGVHVQVLLRCRPFTEEELKINSSQVVLCNEPRREVTVNLAGTAKLVDRTFTFDKVFGQQAQQKDVFDLAVSPIVNEMLEGFNCTIFAYGQTGTGKTYTMEGAGKKTESIELPIDAGVIPRAVEQIFRALESQNAEYSMKVTFLELYNEEITDLLAPDDISKSIEEKQRKPLALMEDGKGGVLVRGLEEEVVYSSNEIFNLLERGSAKRRTAETLLNKQSSRSHSIFSIIVHIKEATLEGEELLKCGKLNLVDLAGSENITRSGAREGRAREAGEINKSLLTLGRVITALVEHSGHVPYRDSKLTRLLRESLGGKTKTCIIATISPSLHCLEETLSTLDYAYRAKSIKNKPELNQKIMKSALIKDLYLEIEKLKTEVLAAREKNGIYLPRDRYLQETAEKKAIADKIEYMESEIQAKDKKLEEMQASLNSQHQLCMQLSAKLDSTQKRLEQNEDALVDAKEKIKEAHYTIEEREYMITRLKQSENALVERAGSLQSELQNSVNDITGLHLKIDRKHNVETQNNKLVEDFHSKLNQHLKGLHGIVATSISQQQKQIHHMEDQLKCFVANKGEFSKELKRKVSSLKDSYCLGLKSLNDLVYSHEKESSSTFEKLNSLVSGHSCALEELLLSAVSEAEKVLKSLQTTLHNQESQTMAFMQQQQKGALQNIEATRAISNLTVEFFGNLEKSTTELCESLYESHHIRLEALDNLDQTYQVCSRKEEQQLIEKIAELLKAATSRKSELVSSKLKHLQENAVKDCNKMEQGLLEIGEFSSKARIEWQDYMNQAEAGYTERSVGLLAKNSQLEELFKNCVKGTAAAEHNWRGIQSSLHHLERNNNLQVDSVVKEGMYNNGLLLAKFGESITSLGSEVQDSNVTVVDSIEGSLNDDRDAGTTMLFCCSTQSRALTDLQTCHDAGTLEVEILGEKRFNKEYMKDEPTCTTPRGKPIEVPSRASIECLRAPDFEKLLLEFQEASTSLVSEKGAGQKTLTRDIQVPIFVDSSFLRDGRLPLTAVN